MPDYSDVLVCYNPIAGRGRGVEVAEAVAEALPGVRLEAQRADTLGADVWRGRRAVVAVGGDGTIRTVVAAMLRAFEDAPPGEPLPGVCVSGLGTANLLSQHLGHQPPGLFRADPVGWLRFARLAGGFHPLADTLADAAGGLPARAAAAKVAAAVRAGRRRELDVAWTAEESAGGGLMLLMAGVGLDGDVIHALQADRTGPITKLSYLPVAARAAWDFAFPELTVEVDGRRVAPPTRGVAVCANVPEYGTGFPLAPGARSDDGLLDAVLLPCETLGELLRLFGLAVVGRHTDAPGAVVRRGRRVSIVSEPAVPVQVDGEAAGHTPLVAEVGPRRVPFLLPG